MPASTSSRNPNARTRIPGFAYLLRYTAVPTARGVASAVDRSESRSVPAIALAIPPPRPGTADSGVIRK